MAEVKPIAQMDALELERKRLELMERQIALQESQAESLAKQVERTAPTQNPNYVVSSLFIQPNGEPWASTLKCDMFIGSISLKKTPMTQEEVALANQIQPLERATVRKVDNSLAVGAVVPAYNNQGKLEALRIVFPMGKDSNPQHYPPMSEWFRQLAEQASVAA